VAPEIHIVREFIDIGRLIVRKVRFELSSNLCDSMDQSLRKLSCTKVLGEMACNGVPELLTNLLVNTLVSQDNERAPRWNDEE
jgi:hypothetical protein